jgi:hypothetical protein
LPPEPDPPELAPPAMVRAPWATATPEPDPSDPPAWPPTVGRVRSVGLRPAAAGAHRAETGDAGGLDGSGKPPGRFL